MMDPPKGKPSDALPPLAELKALRSLQVDRPGNARRNSTKRIQIGSLEIDG